MNKELEQLWYSYISETGTARNEQDRAIINELTEKDEQLRSKLNQEQIKLLEEYDKAFTATYNLLEKDVTVKKYTVHDEKWDNSYVSDHFMITAEIKV